jgi:hypothetical protein
VFDVLDAYVAMNIQRKRINGPALQSFFCKTILDAAKKRVCSLADSFAVCLGRDYPFSPKRLSPEMWSALSSWRLCPAAGALESNPHARQTQG